MTPLDDELRQTLSSRAASVAPPADPLAGVERKAARIRRTRAALAAGGAALAVAAVAVAVPSLTPASHPTQAKVAVTTSPTPSATPVSSDVPSNLLRWGVRGKDAYSPDTLDMRHRFAQALGRPDDPTSYSPLYVSQVGGVSFTVGQAWFDGDDQAYTVSYAVAADNVPQFFLGPVTPKDPWGLAFVVDGMQTYQLLVVVPRPGTGQISYAPHASGAFQPWTTGNADADAVALIHRDLQASDDRLQVLDGDGNLDHPLYEGPVTALLCGLKECG